MVSWILFTPSCHFSSRSSNFSLIGNKKILLKIRRIWGRIEESTWNLFFREELRDDLCSTLRREKKIEKAVAVQREMSIYDRIVMRREVLISICLIARVVKKIWENARARLEKKRREADHDLFYLEKNYTIKIFIDSGKKRKKRGKKKYERTILYPERGNYPDIVWRQNTRSGNFI